MHSATADPKFDFCHQPKPRFGSCLGCNVGGGDWALLDGTPEAQPHARFPQLFMSASDSYSPISEHRGPPVSARTPARSAKSLTCAGVSSSCKQACTSRLSTGSTLGPPSHFCCANKTRVDRHKLLYANAHHLHPGYHPRRISLRPDDPQEV